MCFLVPFSMAEQEQELSINVCSLISLDSFTKSKITGQPKPNFVLKNVKLGLE